MLLRRRFSPQAALLLAVLAFAGWAPAAATSASATRGQDDGPEFFVLTAAVGTHSLAIISIQVDGTRSPTARIVMYMPAKTSLELAKKTGDKLGSILGILEGQSPVLLGATIVVGDPATYANDERAQACAPGAHAAMWEASTSLLGQVVNVPMFIDPTAGAESTLGAFKLQACFSPAQFAGPKGSPLQAVLFNFEDVLKAPSGAGTHVWRAFVGPIGADGSTADASTTYELRSVLPLPEQLAVKSRYDTKLKQGVITGRYTVQGKGQSGAEVEVVQEPTGSQEPITRRVVTASDGSFRVRAKLARTTLFLVGVGLSSRPCSGASTAAGGCLNETVIPPLPTTVKVTVPKPSHRH